MKKVIKVLVINNELENYYFYTNISISKNI